MLQDGRDSGGNTATNMGMTLIGDINGGVGASGFEFHVKKRTASACKDHPVLQVKMQCFKRHRFFELVIIFVSGICFSNE